jgi:integrase/recombinase XerD
MNRHRPLPEEVFLRGEFRRWMIEDRGFSAATRSSYTEKTDQANRYMKATFGRRLVMAQEEHVRAHLATFAWPKTRNVHRTALRSYFRFTRECGYRTTDPIRNIERMREPRYLPRPLTVKQVQRLRAAATTLTLRPRVILDLALFAGPRRSEIASLRWSDVDLAGKRIRFFGKQKEGVIPLHDVLITELQLWRLSIPLDEEWVFPSSTGQRGRHLSGESIWATIKEIGRRAGVSVQPHQCRHSFATELLEQGSDIRHVQELLRHASLSSTQIYTKVAVKSLEPDVARLSYGEA